LRLEAKAFLSGCDLILHGGDVGAATILDELARIAPLTTVRGNNDREPWGLHLHEAQLVQVGAVPVYLIHNIKQLALHPPARRFKLPVAAGELWVSNSRVSARIVDLLNGQTLARA
jgi:predicted phosphodiesterase